jgi:hypothetical protein
MQLLSDLSLLSRLGINDVTKTPATAERSGAYWAARLIPIPASVLTYGGGHVLYVTVKGVEIRDEKMAFLFPESTYDDAVQLINLFEQIWLTTNGYGVRHWLLGASYMACSARKVPEFIQTENDLR